MLFFLISPSLSPFFHLKSRLNVNMWRHKQELSNLIGRLVVADDLWWGSSSAYLFLNFVVFVCCFHVFFLHIFQKFSWWLQNISRHFFLVEDGRIIKSFFLQLLRVPWVSKHRLITVGSIVNENKRYFKFRIRGLKSFHRRWFVRNTVPSCSCCFNDQ